MEWVFVAESDDLSKGQLSSIPINRKWQHIVAAGTAAGVLDIVFALTMWHLLQVPAISVLQTIASGIVGQQAYNGGASTAALGLALHFMMTFVMAWIFYEFAPRRLLKRPLFGGSLYGLCIWAAMTFVIVPLSAAPVGLPPAPVAVADLVAHILLVGIPIAIFTKMGTAN